MKVLHVLEHSVPKLVGYTIRSKYIIENQKKSGMDPVVITSPLMETDKNYLFDFELINGVKYYRTSMLNKLKQGDNLLHRLVKRYYYSRSYFKAIVQVAKKERPDIIHAHSSYLNGIRGTQAARKMGIPSLFEARGLWADTAVGSGEISEDSWKFKFVTHMEFKAMKIADGVVTIAHCLEKHLVEKKIDEKKIWVVPNGVDISIFRPRAKNMQLLDKVCDCGKKVFGFIGSVGKIEGLDWAIKAFSKLDRKEKAVFLIIGDGKDLPRIKEYIRKYDLEKYIFTLGRVPHEEVMDYYSILDVLIYPRINANVNNRVTPLKPLEAMAMGKVVLASDVSGLAEIVQEGINGLLFKANDENDLSKKMGLVLDGDIDLGVIGEKARKWVVDNRSWNNLVNYYNEIYGSLKS